MAFRDASVGDDDGAEIGGGNGAVEDEVEPLAQQVAALEEACRGMQELWRPRQPGWHGWSSGWQCWRSVGSRATLTQSALRMAGKGSGISPGGPIVCRTLGPSPWPCGGSTLRSIVATWKQAIWSRAAGVTGEAHAPLPADASACAGHLALLSTPGPRSLSSGSSPSGGPARGRRRTR